MMPKKHAPFLPTGTETVAIREPGPYHFGDTVHVDFTSGDPYAQGLVQVQAETGGLAQYVFPSGSPVTLGPTPSWSSGGGQGYLSLTTVVDGTVVTLVEATTFEVLA